MVTVYVTSVQASHTIVKCERSRYDTARVRTSTLWLYANVSHQRSDTHRLWKEYSTCVIWVPWYVFNDSCHTYLTWFMWVTYLQNVLVTRENMTSLKTHIYTTKTSSTIRNCNKNCKYLHEFEWLMMRLRMCEALGAVVLKVSVRVRNWLCLSTRLFKDINVCMCVCVWVYVYVESASFVHTCVYIYTNIYEYIYTCMYIHIQTIHIDIYICTHF